MALIGRLAGEVETYVVKSERAVAAIDSDYQPTEFDLKILKAADIRTMKNIESGTVSMEMGVKVNVGSVLIEWLRRGLGGWRNYKNKQGGLIPFKQAGGHGWAHDECLDSLQEDVMEELVEELKAMNGVTEQEKKVSDLDPLLLATSLRLIAPDATSETVTKTESPGDPPPASTSAPTESAGNGESAPEEEPPSPPGT